MKFYRYKQLQRLAFLGFNDVYKEDASSLYKTSQQSTTAGVWVGTGRDQKRHL
jgi:hypothetical protein